MSPDKITTDRRLMQQAMDDFRDAVLHGRCVLESVLDNDQTNAVLGQFDDDFAVLRQRFQEQAESLLDFKRNLTARIVHLESAIRQTLDENGHLADGDVCTLKVLKDALAGSVQK